MTNHTMDQTAPPPNGSPGIATQAAADLEEGVADSAQELKDQAAQAGSEMADQALHRS